MPYKPHEIRLCALLIQNTWVFLLSSSRAAVLIVRAEPCPPILVLSCYVESAVGWAS